MDEEAYRRVHTLLFCGDDSCSCGWLTKGIS
jgi:hypothetical protein